MMHSTTRPYDAVDSLTRQLDPRGSPRPSYWRVRELMREHASTFVERWHEVLGR